jgi:2'-5' RNA ligase
VVGAGFPPETRPFRSHLTLGRWRERAPTPDLPAADLGPLSLETLVLYRSELRREGALYTPLASFPLGA